MEFYEHPLPNGVLLMDVSTGDAWDGIGCQLVDLKYPELPSFDPSGLICALDGRAQINDPSRELRLST